MSSAFCTGSTSHHVLIMCRLAAIALMAGLGACAQSTVIANKIRTLRLMASERRLCACQLLFPRAPDS